MIGDSYASFGCCLVEHVMASGYMIENKAVLLENENELSWSKIRKFRHTLSYDGQGSVLKRQR